MHSFYTNRRGVKKSLRMINTPSAIQLSKNLSRHLRSVSSQVCIHILQSSYSKLSCSSYSSQASLSSPSSPNGCVKLQSKKTYEYVRQIYIYDCSHKSEYGSHVSQYTSVDARHLGASLSERSNATWMGNSSQHTLHHNCESIVVQCCCFVSCMQVCKYG